MTRVPVHTLDSVAPAARPILEHVIDASPGTGRVLNLWGALAVSPVTLGAYMAIRDNIDAHATLDPKIRTAITLTVGRLLGGTYSQAINSRIAERAGWSMEEVHALRSGTLQDPKLEALLAVVGEATKAGGRAEDPTWARAKAAGWSDSELVEAFTFVVLTIFVDYFAGFVDLELDVPPAVAAAATAGMAG